MCRAIPQPSRQRLLIAAAAPVQAPTPTQTALDRHHAPAAGHLDQFLEAVQQWKQALVCALN